MISGRQALAEIVGAERQQQSELNGLDQQLDNLGRQLLALEKRRSEDYRDLARVRVDLVDDGALTGALGAAERQVAAVLAKREKAMQALGQGLEQSKKAREALDRDRELRADAVDAANARIDEAEAATQARLDADPAYQALLERAHEAERIAMHADEKASASEQEQEAKGAGYRGDPLFMYLWRRRFGLAGYKGGGLTRWLDGKVARLIGYDDARLNYQRLLEIPERLREHANGLKQAAEAAVAELRAVDESARAEDGIGKLEEMRDSELDKLDDVDARILEVESEQQALLQRQAAFAAGEDDYSLQAVDYLSTELAREELAELRRDALATPFPDDDQIVARLLEAEQEQRKLSFMSESIKQTRAKHQQKLEEVARLQRDFKRQRMDRSDSGFADGSMVAMMLANFVNGMLDRDALMRVLEEQQRMRPRRADPGFGSGGFGRGTPWSGGLGRLGGGLGGIGRGGGGGFSGGGGGGGFRTGGGF
jgi:hypothetical protein